MLYKSYMGTIKKVFSKAYYPDKYMKLEDKDELNNSINCAIPVKNEEDSQVILNKEHQSQKSMEAKSESFHYEGGNISSNDDSKNVTDKHMLPPLNMNTNKAFNPEIADNIYQPSAESVLKVPAKNKRLVTDNDSISEEPKDEDCSVYEIKSDENDAVEDNIGLMESESRSGENMKTIAVFIIIFAILIFSAGICCNIAFNLSSSVAGWCILLLLIV